MHFREWKALYFDYNLIEYRSSVPNWQQHSVDLDNGLALNRQQAVIWTNAVPIHWRIYTALSGDELISLEISLTMYILLPTLYTRPMHGGLPQALLIPSYNFGGFG